MNQQPGRTAGPITGIVGAMTLTIGTYLHPSSADPNIPLAAFTEYAADPHWVTSHLMQLLGVLLIVATLVLLSQRMISGPAAGWAKLGMAGAIASLATASVLQAVDGIALKAIVNHWAASQEPRKTVLFLVAFGIRQIEIGLASVAAMLFGLTASIFGLALWVDRRFPRWLGATAMAGGLPTAVSGIVMAYTGFSAMGMDINMSASSLLLLWLIGMGGHAWRQSLF